MLSVIEEEIREKALSLGFDLVGFSPAGLESKGKLSSWLARGFHGNMTYMENPVRKEIPKVFPWSQSVISLGVYYHAEEPACLDLPQYGRVSSYAWGEVDYHDFMGKKLAVLADFVRAKTGKKSEKAMDSFPILERAYGRQAGLGWVGKNTCLIHQGGGSYFFLAEVICEAKFQSSPQVPFRCGSCTACIQSCPTGALVAPFQLDSRRCISYLTIEYRGVIEGKLSGKMANLVFGCDICQRVCPWNRKGQKTQHREFQPRNISWKLTDLANMVEKSFKQFFSFTALSRARRRGFLRNLLIAVENSGRGDLAFVKRAREDLDEVVRTHARRV